MKNAQQITGASRLEEIKQRIKTFPAMPSMCRNMLAHCNDPNVDFKKLADKMRYDPGVTANLLKLANSAYFGAARTIDSLQTAMVRLGMKRLFELMVAKGVASRLGGKLDGYDLRPEELLRHSVWVAVASEELAGVLRIKPPELLFTAGLLHDLGKLVLDDLVLLNRDALCMATEDWVMEGGRLDRRSGIGDGAHRPPEMNALEGGRPRPPGDWDAVTDGDEPGKTSFDELETRVLGINHAEAGAEIINHWQFPKELVEAIRHHHAPGTAGQEHDLTAGMVHIADMLAYSEGIGTGIDGLRYTVSSEVIVRLRLKPRIIEGVASRTLEKMEDIEKLLSG